MSPLIQDGLQRWRALSARDQRALTTGAWVIATLLVIALIWGRIESQQGQAARLSDKARQLTELQQRLTAGSAPLIGTMNPSERAGSIERALRETGLGPRLERDAAGAGFVEFDEAPLTQVIELERQLSRQGIALSRYRLERSATPGSVKGRLEWSLESS